MELAESKPSPSEAHPDTMDFLSREWCNFALQSLQPDCHKAHDHSIVLLDNSFAKFQGSCAKMEKSMKVDESDFKSSIPPWKTNDVKSWIWMQQAMHPELNYNGYFRKKFKLPWMIGTLRAASIKKWWKEIKAKRKEEERVQKAEVHAAVSVAGLAAALAAITAENSEKTTATKEAAVASAAAIVAAQCAQVAEAMGAHKDKLSTAIDSAMAATSVSEILTLTAAATTSLRGASTLKRRTGCKKNRLKGSAPVLPIADSSDLHIEFEKNRSTLAKGIHLPTETPDGDFKVRSVSIFLNSEGKVILKLKKLNLLKNKKECVVMNVHVELYKESENESIEDTCYLIVLRTNRGIIKLDVADDYNLYKTWVTTIHHMLTLSASIPTNNDLQLCKY